MKRHIPRNVYLLGLLSLFNDFSADMIAPLLPAFLATMGLGAQFLGVMEGMVDSLSYVTSLLSGWLDDRLHRSKGITVAGYGISALVRPLIAIPIPAMILGVRILDRIGKGIRNAPRDRLLTASLEKEHWGKAFGVQRAMDHTGTLIGPPIAALLLKGFGISFSMLFVLAAVPAILAIFIVPWWIREPKEFRPAPKQRLVWRELPRSFKKYILVIFLLAFCTPSQLFVILKLKNLGMKTYLQPLAFTLLTLCALIAAILGGILADRWSNRRTMALGGLMSAGVFAAFAFNSQLSWSWALICCYGLQTGLVEAAERSYPAQLVESNIRATAMGWYYFAYGLGLLPGSLLFGLFWSKFSPATAFLIYSGMNLAVLPLLILLPTHRSGEATSRLRE